MHFLGTFKLGFSNSHTAHPSANCWALLPILEFFNISKKVNRTTVEPQNADTIGTTSLCLNYRGCPL